MSKKYPGGILRGTPITPSGPYETSSASGIWTLSQVADYIKQGIWPTAGNQEPDQYFNYVTMLLHGDGTNGGQNNTFLDSSTNNFTITRNGNTTQGSFSPYGDLWSNYFDGSGDRLSLSSVTAVGNSNATIEFWIYPTDSSSTYRGIFDSRSSVNTDTGFGVFQYGRVIEVYGNGLKFSSAANALNINQWNHVAITRSSGTCQLYVNGASSGSSATYSANLTSTAVVIGDGVNASFPYVGYISNLRVVIGSVLYSGSTYTVPTSPLTAVSGTSLLTCQSNRFIDTSGNALSITVSGNTSVTNFAPFNPTAAYSTATNGGSGYFDGSGDYLSIADNNAFDVGSSNFTLEAWFYPTTGGVLAGIAGNWSTASQAVRSYALYVNSENRVFFIAETGTTQPNIGSTQSFNLNTWNHVAAVRNGTTLTIYLNGVEGGNTTLSTSLQNASIAFVLGDLSNGGYPFFGYLSQPRLVVGTAVYTAPFTPPSAPLTAIANTQLLCNFTNAAIFDNSMKNDLETVGNAQISTSVKKYGTGSIYLDGTGDNLKSPYTSAMYGDFTIEGWFYQTGSSPDPYINILSGGNTQITFDGAAGGSTSIGAVGIYNGNSLFSSSGQFSRNVWNHIAWVRSGSTVNIYVNGVSIVSGSLTGVVEVNLVGAYSGGGYAFPGYIDDLRITNGVARYTANFTPPTQAFPNF